MIRLTDSLRLANAKLRSHRVRTGIITVIVSLLFACITAVLFMVAGTTQSFERFGKEGLGNRFILKATPIYDSNVIWNSENPDTIKTLQPISDQMKKDKITEAKRLNLEYDPANDQRLPLITISDPSGKSTITNPDSKVFQDYIDQYYGSLKNISYEDFTKIAKDAKATNLYQSSNTNNFSSPYATQGSVTAMASGKEQKPNASTSNKRDMMGIPTGVSTLMSYGLQQFDEKLIAPFLLDGQNLEVGADGSIPVIIPVSAAEEIMNRKPLPSSASSKEQLAFIEQLRKDVAGKQSQLCYRNQTSSELYNTAYQQQDEMNRNKNVKDYVAPSLQYNIPESACGEVTVKKDARSAEEKKQTANQLEFRKKFENYQEADQGIINIRIVGLLAEPNYQMGFNAKDILSAIMISTLGTGWFTTTDSISPSSYATHLTQEFDKLPSVKRAYYAEFADYASAKSFMEKQSCVFSMDFSQAMSYDPSRPDPRVAACHEQGKYFDISPFGNNASAIEDIKQNVWKAISYAAPVVLIIAALVLMGIVGKLISDSRRETAVFRALGATRVDISQIYLTYSLLIALAIIMLSTAIGAIISHLVSKWLSPDLSITAVLVYNSSDIHKQFTLFGVDPIYIGFVCLLIIIATLVSTVIPLLTNLRRNPIRDMRDE